MSAIKSVVLAGATGNIGQPVLTQLLKAGFQVTVLVRAGSKASFPDSVTTAPVDYDSQSSLESAFRGKDAVVSTLPLNNEGIDQIKIIDAAVAAGVQRFIPSEFGSPPSTLTDEFPPYKLKLTSHNHLEKLGGQGEITWTGVVNGPFLDFCTMVGLFINQKEHKIELYDGGDVEFSTTTLEYVGKAVAEALKNAEQTKNRFVYVSNAVTTQNKLLRWAKEIDPKAEWTVTHADTKTLVKNAFDEVEKGSDNPYLMYEFYKRAIWGEGFGQKYDAVDNELLGVRAFGDDDVKAVLAKYA